MEEDEILKLLTGEEMVDSSSNCVCSAYIQGNRNNSFYSMSCRFQGFAVIITNKTAIRENITKERSSIEFDGRKLAHMFQKLGFITLIFENLTASNILKLLNRLGKKDHSNHSSLFVCILGYGNMNNSYIFHERLKMDELIYPFFGTRCPTLVGKPKIFFFQMMSLENEEFGNNIGQMDAGTDCISAYADLLIIYHGFPDSIVKETEFFTIDTISERISEDIGKRDLVSTLTICNAEILEKLKVLKISDAEKYPLCITSTLTRNILFTKT